MLVLVLGLVLVPRLVCSLCAFFRFLFLCVSIMPPRRSSLALFAETVAKFFHALLGGVVDTGYSRHHFFVLLQLFLSIVQLFLSIVRH